MTNLKDFVPEDVETVLGYSSQEMFDNRLANMKAMNIPKFYLDVSKVPYGTTLPADIPLVDALRVDHLEAIESTGAVICSSLDHLAPSEQNLPSPAHKLLAEYIHARRVREG